MSADGANGAARRLAGALRRAATQHAAVSHALAAQLGISATDLDGLALLQDLGAASAGQLAEELGLTTGAVTGVVDRLVSAGFVVREGDPADRRRVIVRPLPERAVELERAYAPLVSALADVLDGYPPDQVEQLLDFEDRAAGVLHGLAAQLNAEPGLAGSAAGSFSAPLGQLEGATLELATGAADLRIVGCDPARPAECVLPLGADELYRARFKGAQPIVRVQDGWVTVRYPRMGLFEWRGGRPAGVVALNAAIDWAIILRGGASAVSVDARELRLRELRVEGGASRFELCLPRPRGTVAVSVQGGLNRVEIQRPSEVPAELQVRGGANRVEFDGQRFGAMGGDVRLASPGWELADDRYAIQVRGGASRLTIQQIQEAF